MYFLQWPHIKNQNKNIFCELQDSLGNGTQGVLLISFLQVKPEESCWHIHDKSRAGAEVLSVAYSCLQESLQRDHHICCIRQQQKSPLSLSKVRAFLEFMLSGSYIIENYDMIGRRENDTLSGNK